MKGFDGQSFDFQGFHNGVFTLLTHRRNEVNVLLSDLGHTDATFITAVAVVHPGYHVAVRIDNGMCFSCLLLSTTPTCAHDPSQRCADRQLHVEVNGAPLAGQHFANETAKVAADLRVVDGEQHAVVVVCAFRAFSFSLSRTC